MNKIILLISLSLCMGMRSPSVVPSGSKTVSVILSLPKDTEGITSSKLTIDLIITLRPIDFVGTSYISDKDCALAKAIKRILRLSNGEVSVGVSCAHFYVGDHIIWYVIKDGGYGPNEFDADQKRASKGGNEILRTLHLTKVLQEDYSL